uniref:HEPN AbiU2-like domain-containing protein n=1 Tax=mine drainage metagenome TaxID=410659 RepID=E6QP16_9ZZZZ
MTKSKHALSASVVLDFCTLCDRAHECWLNHLELFDKNPRNAEFMKSFAAEELSRLSIISQEYGLLQLVKLHDRAVMNGNVTLGIDYVLTYGGWSDSVRPRLEALAKELGDFAKQLLGVRNKILSHNDLATIVAGAPLGAFAKGDDEKYFKALQEFVNTVHDEVIGGPWPFNYLVINDVAAFLSVIRPDRAF